MRLRVGLAGKLFGFLPICWTLIAYSCSETEEIVARWICERFNGLQVQGAKYFSGIVFATLKGE